MTTYYRIHVAGHLHPRWSAWLDEWMITHRADDITVITGAVRDQAELHGLLNQIFGLNLALLLVERVGADRLPPQTMLEDAGA